MSRKKRVEEDSGGGEAWLATYADLVTLLMCFFVLLFAFSNLDAQKFQSFITSFQGGTGVMPGEPSPEGSLPIDPDELAEHADLENLESIQKLIDEYSEEAGISAEIDTRIEERGLVVRSLDNIFFDPGKAEVKEEAKDMLSFISEVLVRENFKDRQVKVEGHTDSDKITNPSNKYPTNWELSVIRATNVLRYLEEQRGIDGNRISAGGYGDKRPIVANDTPENKAKNRRVDIIILRSSYSETEPN